MIQILISSSVLILVLIALRKLLRGKISLCLQYALWLIVAVRLLVPVQFGTAPFSLSSISEKPEQTVQSFMQQPIGNAHTQREVPAEQPTPNVPTQRSESAQTQNAPAQDVQGHTQAERPTVFEAESGAEGGMTVGQALKIVWLIGAGITALWFVAVNAAFRRKALRAAKAIATEECPLPVYVSEHILSPCLLGTLRPRILLTKQATQDERTLRHVLAHETTHYRHGDHIWALVRVTCLCAYWFDPLVWWAASLSLRDCELACDEGAIKRLGEAERLPYGRTLLGMIENSGRRRKLLQTATTMAKTKKQIKERLEMIVKKPKKLLLAVICLLLLLGITVGCTFTGGRKESDAPSNSPSAAQKESETNELPTQTQEKTEAQVVEYWRSEDGAFCIPQIAIEGDYAAQINAAILEEYNVDLLKNGARDIFSSVDYTWAQNGSMLSLAVIGQTPDSKDVHCFVCNINTQTGERVPDDWIYGYAGLAEGDYCTQIELALTRRFAKDLRQRYTEAPDMVLGEALPETFEKLLSEENISAVTPWLDENRNLWCCATVYLVDGEQFTEVLCLTEETELQSAETQENVIAQVVELYRGECPNADAEGNTLYQRVPFLLAPGDYADRVNTQILWDYFRQRTHMGSIDYGWAINGRFLSLAVAAESGTYEGNVCCAVNIDIMNGERVSDDAIYGSLGLSGEEYRALVKKALRNRFAVICEKRPEDAVIPEQKEKNDADANIRSAKPYLDSEGKLWIWGTVYQLAGAATNEYLLPLTDYEFSPIYADLFQD